LTTSRYPAQADNMTDDDPHPAPANVHVATKKWPWTNMLSVFDISLPTANIIYTLSNLALILGAGFVLLGTVGAIFSDGIRERFADGRISKNEADTATANARAAEAEQRAAEARLRLAQITTQRHLTPDQVDKIKPLLAVINPKGKVVVKGRWPDEEATVFATQISQLMSGADFNVVETYNSQHLVSLGNVGVNILVKDM
jgi:hypothetical protein